MRCDDFERRLRQAVETRDALLLRELDAHAAACSESSCRAIWNDHQLVTNAVAGWRPVSSPQRLQHRVLSELTAPASTSVPAADRAAAPARRRGLRGWGVVGCSAAALLLLTSLVQRGDRDVESESIVSAQPQEEEGVSPSPTPATAESRDYVELAQSATWLVTDLTLLIVPGGGESGAEPDAPGPAWIDDVGAAVEPVKDGVSGKLHEWFGFPAT